MHENNPQQPGHSALASNRVNLPVSIDLPPAPAVQMPAPSAHTGLSTELPTIDTLLAPASHANSQAARQAASQALTQARMQAAAQAALEAKALGDNHSTQWMAAIGRMGGLSKSVAKSKAARLNGMKGGRPRKTDALTEVESEDPHAVVHISAGNSLPEPAGPKA